MPIKEVNKMPDFDIKSIFRWAGLGFIVIIALVMFFGCWYTVDVGEVGVVFNEISGKTRTTPQGAHLKAPMIEHVYHFDVKTQRLDIKAEGMSKDLQLVVVDVVLNYHLENNKVNELFTRVGVDYAAKVIVPATAEVVKSAVANFPVENIVMERQKLRDQIDAELKKRLVFYDIVMEYTNIVDIDFAKEFNDIVEKKQIEEQKIKTAQYQKMQAREYKEKTILEAEGEARKQELMKTSVTKDIVSLEWIKKWDGKLPQTMLGDKTMMMINPDGK
ncbi:MAG: hypothetical protein A2452_03010 [Candidatus Firestonebacteria bacterium RIFOXYC2_FULL_39_67]|nr:MAG: hypothetical protein A2536_02425 [Candidatus Firestonebacteria bacterium RIFOXYD2_FULL_39_29]OGF55423.1 MAG: hypothetical protein A2452_03010 [Candidatus Firestonebacteria bacterium RIFOXYC2_FULL_39_67]